jgi:hypothetical protein
LTHTPLPLTKVYIRYREDMPDGVNNFAAQEGFRARGVETAPFYGFGDLQTLEDLGHDVGVVGFVGDVHEALRTLGKSVPSPIDYPKSLNGYLDRYLFKAMLGDVFKSTQRLFVKPVQPKLFTGFLWEGPQRAFIRTAGLPNDTEVWISEAIEFLAEYRVFVLDGEILDVRRYKGDWSRSLSLEHTKEATAAYCREPGCPRAFCLDLGVTGRSPCCLVEVNEAYAFGHYGLRSELYAQMLEATWQELTA